MGWGPLPNPQYLIAVVVQGGGFGSQAAAPVVRQGFDYLVAHPESPTRLASPASTATVLPPPPPPAPPPGTGPGDLDHHHDATTTTTTATTTARNGEPGH